MRIGIDIHICRWSQTGIYTFLWNLIEQLGRVVDDARITMVLYGPAIVDEPEPVERIVRAYPFAKRRHLWTRIAPLLSGTRGDGTGLARILASLDRKVLIRLWRKANQPRSGAARRLQSALASGTPAWWNELDLVHHTAGLLLPLHHKANVMTINDLIPLHFEEQYTFEHRWFSPSFQRASEMDAVIVYSKHTKDDVVRHLGVDAERVHVVPLATNERFVPIENRASVRSVVARHGLEDRGYFLHVGCLEPRKNLVRLVEAFHAVVERRPESAFKLVLAGSRFRDYDEIFATVRRLRLDDRVARLDHVPFDDLPSLMNGAVAFVFPSTFEGFGLPPLEAMACGTPVIASSTTSIPEVVGAAALLVDPLCIDQLTEAMDRVLSDPALAARLSKAGIERAAGFSWRTTALLTFDAYRAAIRHAQRRGAPSTRLDAGSQSQTTNQKIAEEWLFDRFVAAPP